MSVGNATESNREVEVAKRLLKEREEQHAREVDEIRDSHAKHIDSLRKVREEALAKQRERQEKEIFDQREKLQGNISNIVDKYEKQLSDQRSENYDKLGRTKISAAKELNQEMDLRRRMVQDAIDSTHKNSTSESETRNKQFEKMRDDFEKYRSDYGRYFNEKLDNQRALHATDLTKITEDAKSRIDKNINSNSDQLYLQKQGADLRFKKLALDSVAEREAMKRSLDLREQQLIDEKEDLAGRLGTKGEHTFQEYRNQLGDSHKRFVDEANFKAAGEQQAHKNQIAVMEAEHQSKEQQLASQFRKAENELLYKNDQLKHQNSIKESLNEKRHRQDLQLNSDAIRKNAEVTRALEKGEFSDRLRELDEDAQLEYQKQARVMQTKLAELDKKTSYERMDQKSAGEKLVTEEAQKHASERNNIINSYNRSQQLLEEMRDRQLEEQKQHYLKNIQAAQKDSQRSIYKNNLENQTRLFIQGQGFQDNLREQELNHKFSEEHLRAQTKRATDNIQKNYYSNLNKQQEQFADTTQEIKIDNELHTARIRGEADHAKRVQLMDLQAQNRTIIQGFEDKLELIKEQHKNEQAKLSEDTSRLVRDVNRRTKKMLEEQETAHRHEMEMKERQVNDKLRQQELAHKDQIEKLKRTNDLSIKKS